MIPNRPVRFRNIFREVVSSVKVILKNDDNNNSDDEMTMTMITKQKQPKWQCTVHKPEF